MNGEKRTRDIVFTLGCIIIFIWGLDYSLSHQNSNNMSFMLLAGILAAVVTLTGILIGKFLGGILAQVLKGCILKFGWGLALFLFLHISQSDKTSMAGIGVLIWAIAECGLELLGLIKNYITIFTLLRAVIYIITGVGLRLMFAGWCDGTWELGMNISVGDMALYGNIVLSLCSLLSLFCLSEDAYLSKVGKWFGKNHNYKFIGVCLAILLLKDLRLKLIEGMPDQSVKVDWVVAFIILLIVLIIVMRKANIFFPATTNPNLKKHMLEVKFVKEKDLKYVSEYINDFVKKGEKGRFLSYSVCFANELGMTNDQISKMIYPLLEYRDIYMPQIYLNGEIKVINERNMENRMAVVNRVIDSMALYRS